jgi:hypothetical protein
MVQHPLENELLKGNIDTTLFKLVPIKTVSREILVNHRKYFVELKAKTMATLDKLAKSKWYQKIFYAYALLKLIKLYPEPTKNNTVGTCTHTCLDIIEKFWKYEKNPGRAILFKAIYRLALDIFEHDLYYEDRRDWWIEEIVKAILDSKWKPREHWEEGKKWWTEPEPYGGKHSIVYKMWEHRDEIKKILGLPV